MTKKYYLLFTKKIFQKEIEGLSQTEEKLLISFEKYLVDQYSRSVGSLFLYDYFAFQYEYWLGLDTWIGKGKIPVSWIVGKKAIGRWISRPYRDLTKARAIIKQYQIPPIIEEKTEKINVTKIQEWEELEKSRFHNTEEGLGLCVHTTSLFNPNSDLCVTCTSQEKCKEILKKDYPLVYAKRNLDINETNVRRRSREITL